MVGLGNPGEEYSNTRHNLGFLAVEALAKLLSPFEPLVFKSQKKIQAEVAEIKVAGVKIILAKPQTFMNNSGTAVAALATFHKITPDCVWLLHDDMDLLFGKLKIQTNRSAAGHNGVQSVFDSFCTKNLTRFRLGVGPRPEKQDGANFVLARFSKTEEKNLPDFLHLTATAVETALSKGLEKTMTKFN